MTDTRFIPFSRVDSARRVVFVPCVGEIDAPVAALEIGRAAAVGEVLAATPGGDLAISIRDPSTWRKIAEGVLRGVDLTTRTIAKGFGGTAKAVLAVVLTDRPNTNGGFAMFAKNDSGAAGGRPPARAYRLCDVIRGPAPRPSQPTHAQFSKMSGLTKATVPQDQADTAAIYDPSVPPGLRARVIGSRLLAANGAKDTGLQMLRNEIDALVDAGTLEPSVAAAMLRILDPVGSDSGAPGFSSRTLDDAGFTDTGGDYYDPTRAVPGHGQNYPQTGPSAMEILALKPEQKTARPWQGVDWRRLTAVLAQR